MYGDLINERWSSVIGLGTILTAVGFFTSMWSNVVCQVPEALNLFLAQYAVMHFTVHTTQIESINFLLNDYNNYRLILQSGLNCNRNSSVCKDALQIQMKRNLRNAGHPLPGISSRLCCIWLAALSIPKVKLHSKKKFSNSPALQILRRYDKRRTLRPKNAFTMFSIYSRQQIYASRAAYYESLL